MSEILKLDPWPNKLGVNVYLDEVLVGEVWTGEKRHTKVRTFRADGEADLCLKINGKLDPLAAIARCLSEGEPVEGE